MKRYIPLVFATLLLLSYAANATPQTEAEAFAKANDTMMKDMNMTATGDADHDFVTMMIPHHQGAIDMAKVELQFGHDPEIRKLCEGIIKAQEQEITQMKAWLTAHPSKK